jgi:hypothetical protein
LQKYDPQREQCRQRESRRTHLDASHDQQAGGYQCEARQNGQKTISGSRGWKKLIHRLQLIDEIDGDHAQNAETHHRDGEQNSTGQEHEPTSVENPRPRPGR